MHTSECLYNIFVIGLQPSEAKGQTLHTDKEFYLNIWLLLKY